MMFTGMRSFSGKGGDNMKMNRARPVGGGYISSTHINGEGYPDPTAGRAIENCLRQKKKRKRKTKARNNVQKSAFRRRLYEEKQTDYTGDREERPR